MKNTSERRQMILETLCQRRYEKIENFATEFEVSRRTITYDRLLYTLYIIYRKNAKFAKNAKILWRTSQIRKRHGSEPCFLFVKYCIKWCKTEY